MLTGSTAKTTVPAATSARPRPRPSDLARAGPGLAIGTGIPRFLQPKLTVGQPDDPQEQEADRVAERVMRWPASETNTVSHRQCAACNEDEPSCPGCDDQQETVSPKGQTVGGEAPVSVHSVLRSSGEPLSRDTRAFFEPRLGQDFSHVRVHQDQEAGQSAREINALAYTVGSHIAFGSGRYEPGTLSGRRLLAHELTHVAQQNPAAGANVASTLQRQSGDPLQDQDGGAPKQDPATTRVNAACGSPGKSAWAEVAPDVFVTVPDDTVKMNAPAVTMVGCPPGGLGNVGFTAGLPAWQMPTCDTCVTQGYGSKAGSTKGVRLGYIQTVENCLSGGVYFTRDKAKNWVWAGNDWLCVKNARDGLPKSTAPWFGEPGKFGPEPFGTCPGLTDSPFVKLPSRQGSTRTREGDQGGNPLRRMRIDGVFHVWFVAQPPGGSLVYVHHWTIACWVVATLNDDADPCNKLGWQKSDMKSVVSSGPGKGSATPVLTGPPANDLKQPC